MRNLIIGNGEIGQALYKVFIPVHETLVRDKNEKLEGDFEILHICYGYSDKFLEYTKEYIKQYKPRLTIIHSTIPVGTTRKLGAGVVHSPINGQHANMAYELSVYPKFIGALNGSDSLMAEEFLNKVFKKIVHFSSPETTELAKIRCTSRYGWGIIEMRDTLDDCEKYKVPFHEVYSVWNMLINDGFKTLGKDNHIRPIYKPIKGEIKGHCIIPNCDLLDSFVTQTIKSRNETYKLNKEVGNEPIKKSRKRNKDLSGGVK